MSSYYSGKRRGTLVTDPRHSHSERVNTLLDTQKALCFTQAMKEKVNGGLIKTERSGAKSVTRLVSACLACPGLVPSIAQTQDGGMCQQFQNWKVELGRSEVPVNPQLHSKFEVSQRYSRTWLKKKKLISAEEYLGYHYVLGSFWSFPVEWLKNCKNLTLSLKYSLESSISEMEWAAGSLVTEQGHGLYIAL